MILIGSPGAGKTSVLHQLSARLQTASAAHGWIESEIFDQGWPRLPSPVWIEQLRQAVEVQRQAGRDLMLVVATTETQAQLAGVVDAVRADQTCVVCLSAPPQMAAERVAEREPDSWAGKPALVAVARALAASIPRLEGIDHIVSTENRGADDVAGEIYPLVPGIS